MANNPVIVSIDVGFGETKFAFTSSSGSIRCDAFPSITPLASQKDFGMGSLERRDTVIIEINNVQYEIGKDAALANKAHHARILADDFATSDSYMALVYGALSYMKLPIIDLLVVGLPISTYDCHRHHLRKILLGTHRVAQKRSVTIHEAKVLPQPLGGYYDWLSMQNNPEKIKDTRCLIIDPGFFTVDWLLIHGGKPINSRSDSYNGGMSSIINVLAEGLSKHVGKRINDTDRIVKSLKDGGKPKFYGREWDMSDYVPAAKAVAREAAAAIAANVGDGADIDFIVLVGGGALFFKDVIQEKYPTHAVHVIKEPSFSNSRGFLVGGEQWYKLRQAQSVKEA